MWSQTSVEMAFFRPQHAPLVSVTSKLKKKKDEVTTNFIIAGSRLQVWRVLLLLAKHN